MFGALLKNELGSKNSNFVDTSTTTSFNKLASLFFVVDASEKLN
jgi:hypothetical protein